MALSCSHVAQIAAVDPGTRDGCEECLQTGSRWVDLRLCLNCGPVACCDSSPGRHATRHFQTTRPVAPPAA